MDDGCGVAGGLAWLAPVAARSRRTRPRTNSREVHATLGALGGDRRELAQGAHLSRGRATGVRAAAILLAPVIALAGFVAVQALAEALTGLVPALHGEYGIVLAAVLGIVLGARRLLRTRTAAPDRSLLRR